MDVTQFLKEEEEMEEEEMEEEEMEEEEMEEDETDLHYFNSFSLFGRPPLG